MDIQYNNSLFLLLLRKAINTSQEIRIDQSKVDWEYIYQLAERNKVLSIMYNSLLEFSEHIPEELLKEWKEITWSQMLCESQKYISIRKIIEKAQELNLKCAFFKGCVLADLYPNYLSRISSDTDIFIYQKEKEKVIQLFDELGFYKSNISSKDAVYNYINDALHYKVEVHFSLWEDYKSTKIDLLDKMQLTKETSLINLEACGINITTLGYEEHLIYQIFHIIKHFSLQGIVIRNLTDITLYVNKYGKFIPMEEFWAKMEQLNYDKFCENLFYLCNKYLGMSSEILENRTIDFVDNMDSFLMDLMNIGPGYNERTDTWHLVGIMEPYFLGKLEIPKNTAKRKLHILFPAREEFPLLYARKFPVLYPVAWFHRCFLFAFKLMKNKKILEDAKEKILLSEVRLSLLHSLGLADGGKE